MQANAKVLFLATVALVTTLVLVFFFNRNDQRLTPDGSLANTPSGGKLQAQRAESLTPRSASGQNEDNLQAMMQAALAEIDPARRKELLSLWARSVDLSVIPDLLERIQFTVDKDFHSEVRIALLSSWEERDLAGMITWFGERGSVDRLHQEARDQLVKSFLQRDPAVMFTWMENALDPAVRNELYGPFVRIWAASDPVAASAKLRQLAETSPKNATLWNDLIGQVAAQWADSNLQDAISWVQLLPDGPAKSLALQLVSYRWVETDPFRASAYAARQNDIALLRNVAGIWATSNPNSALAWAIELPSGEGRTAAVSSAVEVLAHKSPESALSYANSLPMDETRSHAIIAAVSILADTKPAEAAEWVQQLPEGAFRERALGEVVNSWVASNPSEAGQWLQGLPRTISRDSAVSAFCDLVIPTDPGMAFQLAATITGEAKRNQAMESAAIQWIGKDSEAARASITQSTLPSSIKNQVMAIRRNGK